MTQYMARALAWIGLALGAGAETRPVNDEYARDFNYGQAASPKDTWVQRIRVLEPAYRAEVMWVDYVRVYQGANKDLSGFRLEPSAAK